MKLEDFGSTEVGYATANAKLSRHHAFLYICQDNEAVMKMIIKGRSPTMRHVSRTHRVALDWLFDRNQILTLRSKLNMLTPETNSLTFGPRTLSLLTNGTIFSVCFEYCDAIRCLLAAIFSKQIDETRAMSKRLDARQNGQEKMNSAWWKKSRSARKIVRFGSQSIFHRAEFKFYSAQPGESQKQVVQRWVQRARRDP